MQVVVQDRILNAVAASPYVSTSGVLAGCPGADERDFARAIELLGESLAITGPPYTLTAEGRRRLQPPAASPRGRLTGGGSHRRSVVGADGLEPPTPCL